MVDKNGEQFVAYFMPTDETLKKRRRDIENDQEYDADDEYDFKLAREYTWTVKSKMNSEYDENFYFIMKDNAVYYNALETRVRLSKRRSKNKVGNTRLTVKYRAFNKQELRNQRARARELKAINEEDVVEEEESEEEDDEEVVDQEEVGSQHEEDSQESVNIDKGEVGGSEEENEDRGEEDEEDNGNNLNQDSEEQENSD